MWIVEILPNWAIHMMLVVGGIGMLISFILRFIPFVLQYQLIIQIVSSILLVVSFFAEGALSSDEHWKAQVAQAEAKVAKLELEASQANNTIQYVYVQKDKKIDSDQIALKAQIKKLKKKLDAKCTIDSNAVSILNQSTATQGGKK